MAVGFIVAVFTDEYHLFWMFLGGSIAVVLAEITKRTAAAFFLAANKE